ncbi:MAG: enoyl-CoA hydratase-related protein [Candidatus Binataceae bacterium]
MGNFQNIIYEKPADRVLRITLNRPERMNAMSLDLLGELDQALDEFEQDPDLSVMIIRGAGRTFCTGYDLGVDQKRGSGSRIMRDRVAMQGLVTRWMRLWSLPKPTIAQVHGYCIAGGTELAGHCDLVFAAEDASFGNQPGRTMGILPTMSMWPTLMGPRRTKELFFTGDPFTARQALEWGLINRVYPREKLDEETLNYANRVAMVSVELLTLHKAAVNRYLEITGIRAAEQSAADLDVIAHETDTVRNWMRMIKEKGLKAALEARDGPFNRK